MTVKTFFCKDTSVNGFASLSEVDPGVTTMTLSGWTVAKIAAANFSKFLYGTKRASGTFSTTNALTTAAVPSGGDSFRSENVLDGVFANTNWVFTFAVRSTTASAQTGRLSIRLWRGTNPAGTGATQITSAVVVGTTSSSILTTADSTSVVTWTPGATITLNGEYLFVQCEWEIVGVSGSNNGDVVPRASTSRLVTPDFVVATDAFTGANIAVSSPVFGVGNLSQVVVLAPATFEVASPTIDVGAFRQSHTLLDVDLAVGSPTLDTPTLVETIPSGAVQLSAFAIDNGLDAFIDVDQMLICSAQPTSYANALSLKLGGKTFGPGGTFTAPANASPAGRKVTSTAVTDGTVTATGTVACWVAIDSVNSQWLANGVFTGSGAVVSGQGFSLDAFAIHMTG